MSTGLITVKSSLAFQETVTKLKSRIEAKGLKIFTVINHHDNAHHNGFVLNPTTLIIFGNPKVGAPLMQLNQGIGIDLPMKMLITEKEGIVDVTYNSPNYLKSRHNLANQADAILSKVAMMLNALTQL
tara:strand:- start:902 stop:1285 length:384 start_codon:yes stop_codon:yes gene_type:complete